jgi:DNA-binding response OmpR family regulator
MQVLIVEEERAVADAIANALISRGHQVSVATNAHAALNLPRPDVLIADPEMTGLSGLDLLKEYRDAGCAPRTVFLSAAPSLEVCREALRLGASDFLSKPFRLADLVRAVETDSSQSAAIFDQTYALSDSVVEQCMLDLAAFALRRGVGPTCRARACTALGEIITNVATHAYANNQGEFHLTATVDQRELHISVRDNGLGMETGLVATELMSLGGGLSRVLALSENLDLQSTPNSGTTVQISFGATRVDYAGAHQVDLTELDYLTPNTSMQIISTLELDGAESFFQLSPSLAVVIGRLLAGPDPARIAAQALRS